LVVEKLIDMGETLGATDPAGADLKTVVVAPALFSCERGVPCDIFQPLINVQNQIL
jgi:hypothetical protein